MLSFVKNVLAKRRALTEYEQRLLHFLADDRLDDAEKAELARLAREHELSDDELRKIHQAVCRIRLGVMSSDERITEEERLALQELINHFGLGAQEIGFDQKAFNRLYTLAMVERGVLPAVEQVDGLAIQTKAGERFHWACGAALRKRKTVTTSVRYSGVSTSFRIMKGVRWRTGSVSVSRQTSEYLATEDEGVFWITNQRLGFKGPRKNFALAHGKVLSVDVTGEGLMITKEGKETPYILAPEDHEVPCAILSALFNA